MIVCRFSGSYEFRTGMSFVWVNGLLAKQYLEGAIVSENVYLSLF